MNRRQLLIGAASTLALPASLPAITEEQGTPNHHWVGLLPLGVRSAHGHFYPRHVIEAAIARLHPCASYPLPGFQQQQTTCAPEVSEPRAFLVHELRVSRIVLGLTPTVDIGLFKDPVNDYLFGKVEFLTVEAAAAYLSASHVIRPFGSAVIGKDGGASSCDLIGFQLLTVDDAPI